MCLERYYQVPKADTSMPDFGRTGPDKADALWGSLIIVLVLVAGIVLIVLASTKNIPDLYVLGAIFLFFDVGGAILLLVLLLRPVYRLNTVETDTQVPEHQINDAIRRSKISLNSQNTTDRIHIGSSTTSLQGSDVLIDVKSRLGSATGDKKSVSFYLYKEASTA